MDNCSVNASLNYFCKRSTRTTAGDDFLSSEPLILIIWSGLRSAVEDCLGNNNVDFSGFILKYKLIAATVNKIAA